MGAFRGGTSWKVSLVGAGLALLGAAGCTRRDEAEVSPPVIVEPTPFSDSAALFGAPASAADTATPGLTPAPPLLFDPARPRSLEAPPMAAPPRADL